MPYKKSMFPQLTNPDGSPVMQGGEDWNDPVGYGAPPQAAPRRRVMAPPLQPVRTAAQVQAPPMQSATSRYAPGTPKSDILAYQQQEQHRQALRQQNAQNQQAADARQRAQAEINRQAQEQQRGGMNEWAYRHYQNWQRNNEGISDFNTYLSQKHAAERKDLLTQAQGNVADLMRRQGATAQPAPQPMQAPPVYSMQDATAQGVATTAAQNPYQYATNADPSGITSVVNNYRNGDPAGDRGATQGTVDIYARNAMGNQIASGAKIDGTSMDPRQRRQAEAGGAKLWYGAPPAAQTQAYTPQELQGMARTVSPGGQGYAAARQPQAFNVAPPVAPNPADVARLDQARQDLAQARLDNTTPQDIAQGRAMTAAQEQAYQRTLELTKAANPPAPPKAPTAPADHTAEQDNYAIRSYETQLKVTGDRISGIDNEMAALALRVIPANMVTDETRAEQAAIQARIMQLQGLRQEENAKAQRIGEELDAYRQGMKPRAGGQPLQAPGFNLPPMSFNPSALNDAFLTGVPPLNLTAPPIDMGRRRPTAPSSAPAPTAIQEGQTATNPKTGQKVQYRNGKWVPLQ